MNQAQQDIIAGLTARNSTSRKTLDFLKSLQGLVAQYGPGILDAGVVPACLQVLGTLPQRLTPKDAAAVAGATALVLALIAAQADPQQVRDALLQDDKALAGLHTWGILSTEAEERPDRMIMAADNVRRCLQPAAFWGAHAQQSQESYWTPQRITLRLLVVVAAQTSTPLDTAQRLMSPIMTEHIVAAVLDLAVAMPSALPWYILSAMARVDARGLWVLLEPLQAKFKLAAAAYTRYLWRVAEADGNAGMIRLMTLPVTCGALMASEWSATHPPASCIQAGLAELLAAGIDVACKVLARHPELTFDVTAPAFGAVDHAAEILAGWYPLDAAAEAVLLRALAAEQRLCRWLQCLHRLPAWATNNFGCMAVRLTVDHWANDVPLQVQESARRRMGADSAAAERAPPQTTRSALEATKQQLQDQLLASPALLDALVAALGSDVEYVQVGASHLIVPLLRVHMRPESSRYSELLATLPRVGQSLCWASTSLQHAVLRKVFLKTLNDATSAATSEVSAAMLGVVPVLKRALRRFAMADALLEVTKPLVLLEMIQNPATEGDRKQLAACRLELLVTVGECIELRQPAWLAGAELTDGELWDYVATATKQPGRGPDLRRLHEGLRPEPLDRNLAGSGGRVSAAVQQRRDLAKQGLQALEPEAEPTRYYDENRREEMQALLMVIDALVLVLHLHDGFMDLLPLLGCYKGRGELGKRVESTIDMIEMGQVLGWEPIGLDHTAGGQETERPGGQGGGPQPARLVAKGVADGGGQGRASSGRAPGTASRSKKEVAARAVSGTEPATADGQQVSAREASGGRAPAALPRGAGTAAVPIDAGAGDGQATTATGLTQAPDAAAASGGRVQAAAPAASSDTESERRCGHCGNGQAPHALQRCGGCRSVWYCGTECQAGHWKAHKRHCKLLQQQQAAAAPQGPAGA